MVSLYVQNDGSNAKKGVSKSGVPTIHGFGATSFALEAQRCVTVFTDKPLPINQKYTFAPTTVEIWS